MSAEVAAEETKGPGIVLQPEEGQSYWQPIWANGYSIIKLSPKHAGPDNLAMGIQVIAPGGYVREHSHTPKPDLVSRSSTYRRSTVSCGIEINSALAGVRCPFLRRRRDGYQPLDHRSKCL